MRLPRLGTVEYPVSGPIQPSLSRQRPSDPDSMRANVPMLSAGRKQTRVQTVVLARHAVGSGVNNKQRTDSATSEVGRCSRNWKSRTISNLRHPLVGCSPVSRPFQLSLSGQRPCSQAVMEGSVGCSDKRPRQQACPHANAVVS